jgi:Spy/CpxP family protein refolding chaperone
MVTDTTLRRVILGVGAAITIFGITAAVYASTQNTAGGPAPFIGRGGPMAAALGSPLGRLRMIAPQLGLTDPQKAQIKSIFQSHKDEWKALADRAVTARKALNEAVSAEAIDETVIRQRSADVAAVRADIAVAHAHARAEVFQILTPEQQAQVNSLQSQMESRFEQRRQQVQKRFKQE